MSRVSARCGVSEKPATFKKTPDGVELAYGLRVSDGFFRTLEYIRSWGGLSRWRRPQVCAADGAC